MKPLYLLLTICLINQSIFAQEFGIDDFRISDCGGFGDTTFRATGSDVAYNSTNNNYLVVWYADDKDFTGIVNDETEIIGQFIAADGTEIGSDFVITSHEGYGDPSYDAAVPSITYNSTNNQFLVTYFGKTAADLGNEIYGVLVSATGNIDRSRFEISKIGPDIDPRYASASQRVIYNKTNNEYLAVFVQGNSISFTSEIYGQRLNNLGDQIGVDDFKISNTDETPGLNVFKPDVIWNSLENEYAVVWLAEDNEFGDEFEVYGQLLTNTGVEIGSDFQVSDIVTNDFGGFNDNAPKIAHNKNNNEYLVVFNDFYTTTITEIYGQLFDKDAVKIGGNFQISTHLLPEGSTDFPPRNPDVTWEANSNSYAVVWRGPTGFDYEDEIWMREINNLGSFLNSPFKLSDMGTDGDNASRAHWPNIASNGDQGLLISWHAEGPLGGGLVDGENEIYLQMYGSEVLNINEPDFDTNNIIIFPNPTQNTVNISGHHKNEDLNISLISVLGKIIYNQKFSNIETIQLNFNDIADGQYILKIESDIAKKYKKLIIKK